MTASSKFDADRKIAVTSKTAATIKRLPAVNILPAVEVCQQLKFISNKRLPAIKVDNFCHFYFISVSTPKPIWL